MLVSLTVGKVDAGMAVLLTDDKRIVSRPLLPTKLTTQIEFPSILLPPSITSGSIVDIAVTRNHASEAAAQKTFSGLQSQILDEFGSRSPRAPVLRIRNATQTSVVLEWDPIELATASLRSLSLFRNGAKAGAIPRPHELTATKVSGLAVDSEYTFQLVLRTTAGTLASAKCRVRTHALTNLTGITVTPGLMPGADRARAQQAVARVGARWADAVRIDTTHFVCAEPRGPAWERARELNVPVVLPDWLDACESEGRIVGVRAFYLDADPRLRASASAAAAPPPSASPPAGRAAGGRSGTQTPNLRPGTPPETPRTKVTPPTPEQMHAPEVPPKDDEDESEDEAGAIDPEKEGYERAAGGADGADEDSADEDSPRADPPKDRKKQAKVEDAKEEDANFDDVAL
jgi:hypothetical protein